MYVQTMLCFYSVKVYIFILGHPHHTKESGYNDKSTTDF